MYENLAGIEGKLSEKFEVDQRSKDTNKPSGVKGGALNASSQPGAPEFSEVPVTA